MKPPLKSLLIAIGFSGIITIIGWLAITEGYENVGRVAVWPAAVLVSLMPHPNIGTLEDPIYEGTPLDIVVFYLGLLYQVPIYWLLIHFGIFRKLKQ